MLFKYYNGDSLYHTLCSGGGGGVPGVCASLQSFPEPASSEASPVSYGEANLFFMGENPTGVQLLLEKITQVWF